MFFHCLHQPVYTYVVKNQFFTSRKSTKISSICHKTFMSHLCLESSIILIFTVSLVVQEVMSTYISNCAIACVFIFSYLASCIFKLSISALRSCKVLSSRSLRSDANCLVLSYFLITKWVHY